MNKIRGVVAFTSGLVCGAMTYTYRLSMVEVLVLSVFVGVLMAFIGAFIEAVIET